MGAVAPEHHDDGEAGDGGDAEADESNRWCSRCEGGNCRCPCRAGDPARDGQREPSENKADAGPEQPVRDRVVHRQQLRVSVDVASGRVVQRCVPAGEDRSGTDQVETEHGDWNRVPRNVRGRTVDMYPLRFAPDHDPRDSAHWGTP